MGTQNHSAGVVTATTTTAASASSIGVLSGMALPSLMRWCARQDIDTVRRRRRTGPGADAVRFHHGFDLRLVEQGTGPACIRKVGMPNARTTRRSAAMSGLSASIMAK